MSAESATIPRRTGRGLTENLAHFAEYLRTNQIPAPLTALLDCLKGLTYIDLADRNAFRVMLRANLVSRREDIAAFDRLFDIFWMPQLCRRTHLPEGDAKAEEDQTAEILQRRKQKEQPPVEDNQARITQDAALRYSPAATELAGDELTVDAGRSRALDELIAKLLAALANRISRRYRFAARGRTIDLRRVLRKNMQFGGELILLDYKQKKTKRPRVVFFCDVSGSMDVHALMTLQFVHALKRIDRRTEIFFFATALTRGTRWFAEKEFSAVVKELPGAVAGWGGGTRIGHCMERFNALHGRKLLSGNTVAMIFSDGWDLGETGLLAEQMSRLKRRAHNVIWLNPLAGAKDYQPICRGMAAALPYVDVFLPMGDSRDLVRLVRTLETLMG